ncbi:antibiotic biosynthesis monooxygenase [Duganella sp. FT27W]|uniref:antibiotic biosynthesis monooxygenase family protein n=1 Tax=Duganella sp. FT27W TaxID=2654636 RepID=UPI00128BA8F2|nr:antibiotic biosynthesis monooxygenase [Duganella sp. FT27W]MPQ58137.1 antibiotic biosynthesis monooxygenase [Duganella sp. FT27W]
MIAVIFEVVPSAAGRAEYLARAAQLGPLLAQVDGFISVERYTSIGDPDKLLSLSFWRDEAAVRAWREREAHRAAQSAGRAGVFEHYRLRVAEVVRDYGLMEREQAPPFHPPRVCDTSAPSATPTKPTKPTTPAMSTTPAMPTMPPAPDPA